METNQFIRATVGVVVVFLVIIAVAIPIIGGFTESSPGVAETNKEMEDPNLSLYVLEPDTVVTFENAKATIGDWEFQFHNSSSFFCIGATGFSITMLNSGTIMTCFNGSVQTVDGGQATITFNGSSIQLQGINVNYTGSSSSAVAVLENQTTKPDWASSEDYVQISDYSTGLDLNAYVNSNSVIYANSGNLGTFLIGTYDDMIMNVDTGLGGMEISFDTETAGDAIHLTSYTPSGPMAGSDYNIFVPATYYTELPIEPQISGPAADMVNLVPLLLIVGLIIAAVAAFITLKSRGGGA